MDANRKESVLVSLRKELDLTQKDIADALDVTEQTVRNWEQGKSTPKLTIPQMKTLCRLLQRPIEDIPDDFGPKTQSGETAHNNPAVHQDDDLN
ncbi:helix-turn-helix transcriptional regulator [Leptolyngbya sp. 7M]|uniref:helix-turn-helix transcriptional regulator n=1 Tax=Leptolyngbya sp. 7M TaxID=2812896 RepID=UPI001B8C0B62|nr:helix-turn-helix domain-containing protein [Leptolyngbya sp. 7M]QYO63045.1 helix-turn-helix domain-containing protein [Leptolyngbya sp. 7M]